MTYVRPNFIHKKALKQALKDGRHVEVFQPFLGTVPRNGKVYLEGPHAPEPHRWYAQGTMRDGKLISIK